MDLKNVIKSKFSDQWSKAIVNAIFTGNHFIELTTSILKPYQLNDQHYNILRILRGQHPDFTSPGYIKEVLLNKRGDLTRLLDKLVKLGYVNRHINPENRRMVSLKITDSGLVLMKELGEKMAYFDEVKGHLTEEEAQQLNALLDKLRG